MKNPLAHWKRPLPVPVQVRRNLFSPFDSIFERMMEDFYRDFERPSASFGDWENLMLHPCVDIIDTQNAFKVEAEVPGMGPEDLKISISDHVLTIKGEKTVSQKDKGQNYAMREIAYGSYQRNIPLPESADTEKVKATFKKGMLWIEIPKKAGSPERYREITVESAAS
ncbi:Small heat shock protein HspC2 [Candidatus Glomeribacter gigasporarum BEG34]|uniref:Small heat shock protein HspC2 n=1 Tax=Candidatus Glomeribacter gigasporarum BEG34 TaxID=1070319 RepID=G2JAH9_9BURK|nr:Hsp20/alpha crystallin family protein [Candidatus Glomeribacter gigasporarum]CCD29781.1 Small heat shock protein HspC2 [Candidatus Glomeribacter gigasporarum BEG34]